jgi:IstB-like ATP binding protein
VRPLGEAIAALQLRRGFVPPDPHDPAELERLLLDRLLWPVARLEDELAQTDGPERGRLDLNLELARLRDEVQALRPADCWCLGLGGRGRVYLPNGEQPIAGWRVWCRCPDGQAMRTAYLDRRAELERQAVQDNLDRLWGSIPPAFRDWTLDSLAELGPLHTALANQVRRWLPTDRWLYLYGPTGRAKTGTAIGALHALVARGGSGLYADVRDVLGELRSSYANAEAFAEDGFNGRWLSLVGKQILLLDDLGAERPTDWANETLGQLIASRHRGERRTIITSNLDLVALGQHLRDARTSSRIRERALVLDCSALPDMRLS